MADAENLLAFRKQIAFETTNTMQYVDQAYPTIKETAKRLQTQLEDRTTINVGAFSGNHLVAYLNFRLPWADHPWVAHLAQFGMMVLKNFWGQGIGKKLLYAAEEHARTIDCSYIIMSVIEIRHELIAWYERHGYYRTGEIKPFPTGPEFGIPKQPLQFIVMKKFI